MSDVRETKLPGVGVRHEFTSAAGELLGVLVYHDGRRQILRYDSPDADACSSMVTLSAPDARTLAELLGASQVTEVVSAVQQEIEGLAIEWLEVGDGSPALDTTIGGGRYRTRTGASVVAVIRDHQSIPAPGPEFTFRPGDVVVAVGTPDGVAALRRLIRP
jgi:K+:H+ antiporter subunit KhtT